MEIIKRVKEKKTWRREE